MERDDKKGRSVTPETTGRQDGNAGSPGITRRTFLDAATAAVGGGLVAVHLGTSGCGESAARADPGGDAVDYLPSPVVDLHTHVSPNSGSFRDQALMSIVNNCLNATDVGNGIQVVTYEGISCMKWPELMDDVHRFMEVSGEGGVTLNLVSFSMELELISRCLQLDDPEDKILTEKFNDAMYGMSQLYPDRLATMAMVNPFNPHSVDECIRCSSERGTKGININSNWKGALLDDPVLEPFWQHAADSGEPVFIHPPYLPACGNMGAYKLEETLGRPVDYTMAILRMIMSGVFDRHEELKVVACHMGGLLPVTINRADFGYELGYTGLPEGQAAVCEYPPSRYLQRNLYVDCMGFSAPCMRLSLEMFGVDRILFGSDFAAVPTSPIEHINMLKTLGLSQEELEKILWKNADTLFKLGI